MTAGLRDRDVFEEKNEELVDNTETQKMLSLKILAFRDNRLRSIEKYEAAYSALQKLHQ